MSTVILYKRTCGKTNKNVPSVQTYGWVLKVHPSRQTVAFLISTDTAINGIINSPIERLCETNNPSLETIKMQVSFDSRHLEQALVSWLTRYLSVQARKLELKR